MTEWMIEINESMKFAKFIFQKCPGTGSFYGLYVKSSSHYSLVHRLPASSSKSAPTLTVFFYIFKCESTSRYRPVHFLSATFADRGRQPRKQRPYTSATTEATLHKKAGFRARESFQAWIHAFPTCCTSQLLDDDDDVVDMMMMVRMLPDNRP
jgi:hypothetical protein